MVLQRTEIALQATHGLARAANNDLTQPPTGQAHCGPHRMRGGAGTPPSPSWPAPVGAPPGGKGRPRGIGGFWVGGPSKPVVGPLGQRAKAQGAPYRGTHPLLASLGPCPVALPCLAACWPPICLLAALGAVQCNGYSVLHSSAVLWTRMQFASGSPIPKDGGFYPPRRRVQLDATKGNFVDCPQKLCREN